MILLLNCIADPATRTRFDENVVPHLAALAGDRIRSVALDSDLPGATDFSHLVLSGSELSAARENPRDGALIERIRAFADAGRPILGICYGHQMIARAFGGTCRRAARPEFGWKTVELSPSPHFAGIDPPFVTAHSHLDEVPAPPDGFQTIASTDLCAVQAMAAPGILGVQFHPEMTHERAETMFEENVASGAVAGENVVRELRCPADASKGERIFANFFGATG